MLEAKRGDSLLFNATDMTPANTVIGIILLFGDTFQEARDIISANDFYNYRHQDIWKIFEQCISEKVVIDINAVMARNISKEIDVSYLVSLTQGYPDPRKLRENCQIVKQQNLVRQSILMYQERIHQLSEGMDPGEVISKGITDDADLLDKNQSEEKVEFIGDGIIDFVNDLEEKIKNKCSIVGLTTGYYKLDFILGGLDSDTINVLAARPGTGKTTLAINIAKYISKKYGPVYFGSLEMSRKPQLQGKFLAQQAEFDSMAFRNTNLLKLTDIDFLTTKAAEVADYPIIVDSSTEIKASQMLVRMRKFKKRYGIRMAIIDYLQLIEPEKPYNNRRFEINDTLRILKKTTRELQIPIILICQMNREIEKRASKKNPSPKPVLSDLNESGNIEQDASSVMFLYHDNDDRENIITLNIAKNRYGPADQDIKFQFDKKKSIFKLDGPPMVKVH